MITKAEKFWDKQAVAFKNSESQSDAINKDIIARIRKHLSINDNVLDFGCATGTKTIELAGGVKHIHGLDLSSEMIRYALIKKKSRKQRMYLFQREHYQMMILRILPLIK
ncbi:MAG: methyltransferase domain-containing protein [Bacteroidales bacterium]|nr:methyltransferase domain-containing protein [Bacteroidales bacterium]